MYDDDDVRLDKDTAEELESFLRVLYRHSLRDADLLSLRQEGLSEALQAFADTVESALDQMREDA